MAGKGEVGVAYLSVVPSTRGFAQTLSADLKEPIGSAGKAAGKSFSSNMAMAGSALAAVGASRLVKEWSNAASDVSESTNKVRVVFGNAANEVIAFSEDSATAMGISQNATLEAAGTFGNLFVSMGLAGKQSAEMSTSMVQLASDMASFNNASPEDVLLAIRAGLVGETEPLRRFGVNLNDATLREKALSMGLTTTTKDVLPPAIKAQAAYALILEQTGTAQGDFARTADGMANKQRINNALLEDAKAKLGEALVPALTTAYGAANEVLGVFNDLPEPIRDTTVVVGGLGTAALIAAPSVLRLAEAAKALQAAGLASEIRVGAKLAAEGASVAEAKTLGWGAAIGAAARLLPGVALGTAVLNSELRENSDNLAVSTKFWADREIEIAKAIGTTDNVIRAMQETLEAETSAWGASAQDKARARYVLEQLGVTTKETTEATKESATAQNGATKATENLTRSIEGLLVAQDSLAGKTRSSREAEIAHVRASLDAAKAHAEVSRLRKEGKTHTDEYTRALLDAEEADLRLNDAAHASREAQHVVNQSLVQSAAGTSALSVEQKVLVERLNASTDRVSKLKDRLDSVPRSKRTKVEADIKDAEADLAALKREVERMQLRLRVKLIGGGTVRTVMDGRVTQVLVNRYGGTYEARPGGYLTTIAEGVRETAIPHEDTPRSRALLAQAAQGVLGGGSGPAGDMVFTDAVFNVTVPDGRSETFKREVLRVVNEQVMIGRLKARM